MNDKNEKTEAHHDPVREMLKRPFELQKHEPGKSRMDGTLAKGLIDPSKAEDPKVALALRTKDHIRLYMFACSMGDYEEAFTRLKMADASAKQLRRECTQVDIRLMAENIRVFIQEMYVKTQAAQDSGLKAVRLIERNGVRELIGMEPYDPNEDK